MSSSHGILRRSTDDSHDRDAISSRSVGFIEDIELTDGPSVAPQKLQQSAPGSSRTSQSKQCWICLMSDDDDSSAVWSRPCNCKGTSKWVHHSCLQRWIDEQQKSNRHKTIKCPQCKTRYLIFYPKSNALVVLLDRADALVYKVSPFITAGILIGCVYWCATTYGAVATIQVAGEAEAKELFEKMTPSLFLTALPCIPLYLIALQTIRWEDYCLVFLRNVSPSLPVLNRVLPSPIENGNAHIDDVTDGMACTRVFTSALLLPTVAAFFGSIFFGHVSQGIKRSIFGGLVFIGVRGIIKMYHKQEIYKRNSKRQILDYTEENVRLTGSGETVVPSGYLSENEIFTNENPEDIQTLVERAPKPGRSVTEDTLQQSIVSEFMKNETKPGAERPAAPPFSLSESDQSPVFESTLKHSRTFLHSPSDDSPANKPQFGNPQPHRSLDPPESKAPLKSPPLIVRSPSYKDKPSLENADEEKSLDDFTHKKTLRIEEGSLKNVSPELSPESSPHHNLDTHGLSLTPMPPSTTENETTDIPSSGKENSTATSPTTKPKSEDSSYPYIS